MSGDWESVLNRAVADGVQSLAVRIEKMLAELTRTYRGQPVSQITPVLAREWHRVTDGSITDPELTEYARHISEGTQIKVNVQI